MTTIRIEDLQRDPLGYLHKVEAGETLIVLRADKPIAEIKPASTVTKPLRPYGLCAGEFTVPDDFDEPLPEEILRQIATPSTVSWSELGADWVLSSCRY